MSNIKVKTIRIVRIISKAIRGPCRETGKVMVETGTAGLEALAGEGWPTTG
jgi:hypothetical protein